jgi:hypothetical protein
MDITISAFGPYSLTEKDALPLFSRTPQASSHGVYLQTVELPHGFRVAEVGETGDSFAHRLRYKSSRWLAGSDRRSGQTHDLDPISYRQGIRIYITPPPDDREQRRWREEILNHTLVFFLPLTAERGYRCAVEAALIRRLKSNASSEVASFIYNDELGGRICEDKIAIQPPTAIVLEGLQESLSDSC